MGRENAGYKIIGHFSISENEEIALGYNKEEDEPYVIWKCLDGKDYYQAQYFTERKEAVHQFMKLQSRRNPLGSMDKGGQSM